MRKILVLLICLSGSSASAKVLFACEGRTPKEMGGQTIHYKLSSIGDSLKMELNGQPVDLPVEAVSIGLPGLEDYLKCGAYDESCKSKVSKDHSGYQALANMIALGKDAPAEMADFYATTKLDVSKIARGQSYLFGKNTQMGRPGVFEYYDKQNRLLGRYIYNLATLDCSDKAEPTVNMEKILKDLAEPDAAKPPGISK